MKKVIKASNGSKNKVYWAEVRMKVAVNTNSDDVDEIADNVYDIIADALANSGIKDYEWIDVSDVAPDRHN